MTDIYRSFVGYKCGNFDSFLVNLSDYSKRRSANELLDYLIENSKLEKHYAHSNNYQAIATISKLRSIAFKSNNSPFKQSLDFLEFITRCINFNIEEDEAPVSDEDRKKGVVSVYTIHKAKGLSFPVVIINGIDESLLNPKKFPKILMSSDSYNNTVLGFSSEILGKKDMQYKQLLRQYIKKLLEEELRILYVACTRAKHILIFSCNESKEEILNKNGISWAKWILKDMY